MVYTITVNLATRSIDLVLLRKAAGPESMISFAQVPDNVQISFYKQLQAYVKTLSS